MSEPERPTWRRVVLDAIAAGVDPQEARWIGEEASGSEGAEWAGELDRTVTDGTWRRFDVMVERRQAGEPLQYVLGHWQFRQLDLLVDRRVLIPRPETEWVVEAALGLVPVDREAIVVDLGTGSGAIGLSFARELWPRVRVVATDVSADALAVARANLAGLGRPGTKVELHEGDWFDALPPELEGEIDLLVSNPPYVAPADHLPPEVADWEPVQALVPGPSGLEAIEVVLKGAARWVRPGGAVVCEIGETQGEEVRTIAAAAGLDAIEVRPDPAGRDRMVVARRP